MFAPPIVGVPEKSGPFKSAFKAKPLVRSDELAFKSKAAFICPDVDGFVS